MDAMGTIGEVHHGRSCGDQRASGSSERDPSPASTLSEYTQQAGDSTATENEEGDDDEPSAVADDEPRNCGRHNTPRNTTPTAVVVGRPPLANAKINDAEDVGNIGFSSGIGVH